MSQLRLDLYDDPWIQCDMTDGTVRQYGIRDCLVHASEIRKLSVRNAVTYMDNVSPFVLISMLTVRIYNPKDNDDKLDLWETGIFDVAKFDEYIAFCRGRGISFDVFDKEHPFLQIDRETLEIKKPEIKPVGSLDPVLPSGQSLAFYHGNMENNFNDENMQFMYPDQFAASLIRNAMYRSASGGGYVATGINKSKGPLFVLPHGKNLFETVVISMHTEPRQDIRDNDCPFWEAEEYGKGIPVDIPSRIDRHSFGYLSSTLCPVIMVRYSEVRDEKVRSVFCASMFNKTLNPDPDLSTKKPAQYSDIFLQNGTNFICCRDNQDKLKAEVMREEMDPWYCFASVDASVIDWNTGLSASEFIKVLCQEHMIASDSLFPCEIFGLTLSGMSIPSPSQSYACYSIPAAVLEDSDKGVPFIARIRLNVISRYIRDTQKLLLKFLAKLEQEQEWNRDSSHLAVAPGTKTLIISSGCKSLARAFMENMSYRMIHVTEDGIAPVYSGWMSDLAGDLDDKKVTEIVESIQQEALSAFSWFHVKKHNYLSYFQYRSGLEGLLRKTGREAVERLTGCTQETSHL